jgi:hypothetical protein
MFHSINGESSALLLLSLGVAVPQRRLQEHSAECVSAKSLQKSLEHANISVDESTIHKKIKQEWCSWEDTTEEATAVQRNIIACLRFAKEHLDVPQRYWQNILGTD